jgi:hypothetical protein
MENTTPHPFSAPGRPRLAPGNKGRAPTGLSGGGHQGERDGGHGGLCGSGAEWRVAHNFLSNFSGDMFVDWEDNLSIKGKKHINWPGGLICTLKRHY